MNRIYRNLIVGCIALIGLSSCDTGLNIKPIDPNTNAEFNQQAEFTKIYSTLALTGQKGPDGDSDIISDNEGYTAFYRILWVFNEFPSDEGIWVWNDAGVPELKTISWTSSNAFLFIMYNRLYFDITLCNHFLANTEDLKDAESLAQRDEVRFIRALNYFHLLDLIGDVPFATKVTTEKPDQISRKDLYAWLESELLYLSGSESNMAEPLAGSYYRADKAAAWMLLARMYLNAEVYTGTANWDGAAEYAAKVMTSGYTLAPNYRHIFMGDNDNLSGMSGVNQSYQEFILPVHQDGIYTRSWGGAAYLVCATRDKGMNPWGSNDSWSCFRSSPELLEKFTDRADTIKGDENYIPTVVGDDRAIFCQSVDSTGYVCEVKGEQGGFKDCWSVPKWTGIHASGKIGSDVQYPDTDIPLMRVAEAYLTYAEAVFRGGKAVNGSAEDAVKAIRERAHNTKPFTLSETFLLDEWAREFYFEGRRRSDLVRFGKFAGETADYNWEGRGGADSEDDAVDLDKKYNVYPIPDADIVANDKLKQIEGYE